MTLAGRIAAPGGGPGMTLAVPIAAPAGGRA